MKVLNCIEISNSNLNKLSLDNVIIPQHVSKAKKSLMIFSRDHDNNIMCEYRNTYIIELIIGTCLTANP